MPTAMTELPRRHHLLLAGALLFMLGVQFRMVDSFTLNERSTRFVATQMGGGVPPQAGGWQTAPIRKVIAPPRWLGLALMSVGGVLSFKALSSKGSAG